MAFGIDDDLDSGFRQNDGVGVEAHTGKSESSKAPSRLQH
jgi:hypothetical protein